MYKLGRETHIHYADIRASRNPCQSGDDSGITTLTILVEHLQSIQAGFGTPTNDSPVIQRRSNNARHSGAMPVVIGIGALVRICIVLAVIYGSRDKEVEAADYVPLQ